MTTFKDEVDQGERFEFGKNWKSFLTCLNEERIQKAESSFQEMFDHTDIKGKRFLDIGSGSGLSSLVAFRSGAIVHSFDYDAESVACTRELRSRYFPENPNWTVEQGSVLDKDYITSLGTFDIVYSWGVLHHTGEMWDALDNAAKLVNKNGLLCIAIYNNQGFISKLWKKVKQIYCSGPKGKAFICCTMLPYMFLKDLGRCIVNRENIFSGYKKNRGMSITHDWYDWLGGYPFEVARIEEIFNFYKKRGFVLTNIKDTSSLGTNEFVFVKS